MATAISTQYVSHGLNFPSRRLAPGLYEPSLRDRLLRPPSSTRKAQALPERKQPTRVTWDATALLLIEGEDAKITGGTRSLMRRVLALNLRGGSPLTNL